jgi:hypothetical protein
MSSSILTTVKKVLGIDDDYTAFDVDIIMHINTVFSILHDLGVGPIEGFAIEDRTKTWDDYLGTDLRVNSVKTYIYLRVRLLFDPPTTSYLQSAMEAQYKELEWRLNVQRENDVDPILISVEDIDEDTLVVDGGQV